MVPALLLLVLGAAYETTAESEPIAWPLFEFWSPLTWLKPKFSSETMFHILRAGPESNRKLYRQLKRALLPINLFLGNIRAQYAAWDSGKARRPKKNSGGPLQHNGKKPQKVRNK